MGIQEIGSSEDREFMRLGIREFTKLRVREFSSSRVREFRSSAVQEFVSSGVPGLGGVKALARATFISKSQQAET